MAIQPAPQSDLKNVPLSLQIWYNQIRQFINSGVGTIPWASVSKVGANLTDIPTRNHNDLQNIQGGSALERYHLTAAQVAAIGTGGTQSGALHGNDGDPGDDAFPIPGPQGIPGPTGATGPGGSGAPGVDGADGEEVMMFLNPQVSSSNANTSTLIYNLGTTTLSGAISTLTTSIPATAKRITIIMDSISTTGTTDYLIQIGSSSGGFETSGYDSTGGTYAVGGPNIATSTAGFVMFAQAATVSASGHMTLLLVDTNRWIETHNYRRVTTNVGNGTGLKTLSDTLDRIRITTTGGVETFDAGTITIWYENDLIVGLTGPQGVQGIPGPIGDDGLPGEDSHVPGPFGPQGPIGPIGIGLPGEEGLPGEDSYIAGPIGPRGPQGDRGYVGDSGEDGQDGMPVPGPQGFTGPQGIVGPMGPIGMDGEPGEYDFHIPGPIGATGPAGSGQDPTLGSFAPGTFSIPTGKYAVMSKSLILTGSQRATIQGTGVLRIT